ncbi:MAG: hypothetical protein CMH30_06840 [Micavibrio sp.]|nr:hypothetical protein [Micavibrio sp.]|tara:strand:+ start:254 stop:574 length:321 start_codon:yes stop_codon:yes gene_type:complete
MLSKLKNKLQRAFTRQNATEIGLLSAGLLCAAALVATFSKPDLRIEIPLLAFYTSASLIGASILSNFGRVQRGAVVEGNEQSQVRDCLIGATAGLGTALIVTAPFL